MTTDPILDPGYKGYPRTEAPRALSTIGSAGWHVLDGRLPLPLAVLKRSALSHNLAWMQAFVRERGIDLAPHGKTTMSPQLFTRQLDTGAWGLSFATVTQLAVGVQAGARRTLIANQVVTDDDLAGIQALLAAHASLRVVFLVDSTAQLALIEQWFAAHPGSQPFEVMLEIGVPGARTGCRTHEEATALARALHASPATRLAGIECYEGMGATGRTEHDAAYADALMTRVEAIAKLCAEDSLFAHDEVLLSAGGSAIFDLVAGRLTPLLGRPVRGLLRSGCYITHDHGNYKRLLASVAERCGFTETLQPALEVWAAVQSRPEPGLAILTCGRRDISYDQEMPIPFARAPRGMPAPQAIPASWTVTALNDQHAFLRWDAADEATAPVVGERVGLGISHPCTTFDKWHWMPIVEDDYRVTDAVTLHF
ncbi:amino acid deaminase [Pseudorhodoferax soli]|uniref:D-serine dehydratase n=1 Tax=Pseudorhodoferax soli TaxID=545864 RepID=A0A368Y389_9BURK|nr:amino acid deaminase [Pseudorhodoferax soli]RCW74565.1 D-serine dehydratase [Pseudorhodoferax soli]